MTTMPMQTSLGIIDILSKFIVPLLVAALAAYFSTKFALNKFYKEKWWEKRLEAFTEIINIAYRIKMSNDYFLSCEYAQMEPGDSRFKPHPKEIEEKLRAEYWLDLQELERIAQLADFTLTTTVKNMLDSYVNSRKKVMDDWYDDAIESIDASIKDLKLSEKLLSDLVKEAKRELKIK
ncbi:hypothetical protein [Klebsiella aerogenes]|uniref:hypothetical protein n=1 Tax=Klebsiella aerogenes TaxID=548 RepID=UPI0021D22722|nr:hypothetical protein [Klebsiella aerogenes]MCU6423461.1 hypothetical protein [Klebsiella aerogenes]WPS01983.1 hypothetical protein SM908_15650 [Klebsiella aerogenes]HDT5515071.1 hypothetical protein [Klebsiella aerogenes]